VYRNPQVLKHVPVAHKFCPTPNFAAYATSFGLNTDVGGRSGGTACARPVTENIKACGSGTARQLPEKREFKAHFYMGIEMGTEK